MDVLFSGVLLHSVFSLCNVKEQMEDREGEKEVIRDIKNKATGMLNKLSCLKLSFLKVSGETWCSVDT